MTQQLINCGPPYNTGLGDPAGIAFGKVNANFAELYSGNTGNIVQYGAVPGSDCTSAVTTAAAANSQVVFPPGAWVINSTPTMPTGVNIIAQPGATFTGAGAGILGLANGAFTVSNQISDYNPPVAGELATLNVFRNPHYTGGPAGVCAGIRVQTNVGALVTNNEWAILGIINNSAAVGTGQQVAVYGQGNKGTLGVRGGPVWGMVSQATDKSGLADPTDGLVSHEFDVFADSTDANLRRIGIDIVGGVAVSVSPTIAYGLRIGPSNGVAANCTFTNGIYLRGVHTSGIVLAVASGSGVGIDVSQGTFANSAIRIGQAQLLAFKNDDSKTLRYSAANVGLTYAAGGSDEVILYDSGAIGLSASGTLIKLVGTSSTGTATATIGANKPGANNSVIGWLSILLGGTQGWIPVLGN